MRSFFECPPQKLVVKTTMSQSIGANDDWYLKDKKSTCWNVIYYRSERQVMGHTATTMFLVKWFASGKRDFLCRFNSEWDVGFDCCTGIERVAFRSPEYPKGTTTPSPCKHTYPPSKYGEQKPQGFATRGLLASGLNPHCLHYAHVCSKCHFSTRVMGILRFANVIPPARRRKFLLPIFHAWWEILNTPFVSRFRRRTLFAGDDTTSRWLQMLQRSRKWGKQPPWHWRESWKRVYNSCCVLIYECSQKINELFRCQRQRCKFWNPVIDPTFVTRLFRRLWVPRVGKHRRKEPFSEKSEGPTKQSRLFVGWILFACAQNYVYNLKFVVVPSFGQWVAFACSWACAHSRTMLGLCSDLVLLAFWWIAFVHHQTARNPQRLWRGWGQYFSKTVKNTAKLPSSCVALSLSHVCSCTLRTILRRMQMHFFVAVSELPSEQHVETTNLSWSCNESSIGRLEHPETKQEL